MSKLPQQPDESNSAGSSAKVVSPEVLDALRQVLREEMASLLCQDRTDIGMLLSVRDAANLLGLSVRSVEDLIAMGELPVADVGPRGGKRKITSEAVEAYVRRCAR